MAAAACDDAIPEIFDSSPPSPPFIDLQQPSPSSSPTNRSSSLSPTSTNPNDTETANVHDQNHRHHRSSDSFSSMNSESLQMCTEGLGFESFDDVEDLKTEPIDIMISGDSGSSRDNNNREKCDSNNNDDDAAAETWGDRIRSSRGRRKRRSDEVMRFPPPISGIGRSCGVWFESCKEDGRFILRQVRVPAPEFLHACRENGRLRLCLVQSEAEEEEEDEKDNIL